MDRTLSFAVKIILSVYMWNVKNGLSTPTGDPSISPPTIQPDCELTCFKIVDLVICINITSPEVFQRCVPANAEKILVRYSNVSHLPARIFSKFTSLRELDLRGNYIAFLSEGVFDNLKILTHL
ncbi:uncharacterized protein LOC144633413 [Oculina patagonica]